MTTIDRELDFLRYLKQSQPPYLDALFVLAKAAPQGARFDSLSMNRRGDLSLRGSMKDSQQVVGFRSKLIDSGFFANVAVEEQTPTPDRQKLTVRISAQWKPAGERASLAIGPTAEEIEKAKTRPKQTPGGAVPRNGTWLPRRSPGSGSAAPGVPGKANLSARGREGSPSAREHELAIFMRTLTHREKRTIRLGAAGIAIYLLHLRRPAGCEGFRQTPRGLPATGQASRGPQAGSPALRRPESRREENDGELPHGSRRSCRAPRWSPRPARPFRRRRWVAAFSLGRSANRPPGLRARNWLPCKSRALGRCPL